MSLNVVTMTLLELIADILRLQACIENKLSFKGILMARTLANYEQLFDLSRRLNVMSGEISELRAQGDSIVNGTEWDGVSANRFRDFWKQFSLDLTKAQEILTEGSLEVDGKAQLYQRADA